MITVKPNDTNLELYGLSKDKKPTDKIYGYDVMNSSVFIEMDTGNCFMYSAEDKKWYQL